MTPATKKAAVKLPPAAPKGLAPGALRALATKLKSRDFLAIDAAVATLASGATAAQFDALLTGSTLEGFRLEPGPAFRGTSPAQVYLDHAVRSLIGAAPEDSTIAPPIRAALTHAYVRGYLDKKYAKPRMHPVDLSALARFANLRSLTIADTDSIERLDALAAHPTFDTLRFMRIYFAPALGFETLSRLKELSFSQVRIPSGVLAVNKHVLLRKLALGHGDRQLTVKGLDKLAALEQLSLNRCSVKPFSFALVPTVRELYLRGLGGWDSFEGLDALTKLEALDVDEHALGLIVKHAKKLGALRSLTLDVTSLVSLKHFPRIRALVLDRLFQLDDLTGIEAMSDLEELTLHDVGERVNYTPLTTLSKVHTLTLDDMAGRKLAPLGDMKSLRTIHLRNMTLTDLPKPLRKLVAPLPSV